MPRPAPAPPRLPLRPSRRDVLRAAAAAASAGLVPTLAATPAQGPPEPPPAEPRFAPWWMHAAARSRVVEIASEKVLTGSKPEPVALIEMLHRALLALVRAPRPADAWRRVLGDARRIVLKFNSVGAGAIATNDVFAAVLVRDLAEAGYEPAKLTLIEAPDGLAGRFSTRRPTEGWGETIIVGDQPEQLAAWLLEADAVINVPFLKTHQLAGMSGCCKNLSHAVIRRPARYHANGCSPFVGQVVGSAQVSSRLKLSVMNALRIVADGGPDATEAGVFAAGSVLMGFDPVAVDSVGLGLLQVTRRRLGFPESLPVRYIDAAAADGVGRADRTLIDREVVQPG